ncbi:MAG: GTP pyrophosphokinase family protein [Clostridia bacterium]
MIYEKTPQMGWSKSSEGWQLPEGLSERMESALEMFNQYQAAIRQMSTRLEILDDEFQLRHSRNPIHHMQSRLKTPQSMMEKLKRKNMPQTIESALETLQDIAGIRVVCSYIHDVYALAELIARQDDIVVVRQTDYIRAPKPNGYRSLHMIVRVPVFFSNRKEHIPVEIQIRTIAMDFWASLEHELKYKMEGELDTALSDELRACSNEISKIDERMQKIAQVIDASSRP